MADDVTTPVIPTPAVPTHKPNGQFAKGNRCARGNPENRAKMEARALWDSCVKSGHVKAVYKVLYEKALKGIPWACKFFVEMSVGRPRQAMDVTTSQDGQQQISITLGAKE